jgi:hypothetical protein
VSKGLRIKYDHQRYVQLNLSATPSKDPREERRIGVVVAAFEAHVQMEKFYTALYISVAGCLLATVAPGVDTHLSIATYVFFAGVMLPRYHAYGKAKEHVEEELKK